MDYLALFAGWYVGNFLFSFVYGMYRYRSITFNRGRVFASVLLTSLVWPFFMTVGLFGVPLAVLGISLWVVIRDTPTALTKALDNTTRRMLK